MKTNKFTPILVTLITLSTSTLFSRSGGSDFGTTFGGSLVGSLVGSGIGNVITRPRQQEQPVERVIYQQPVDTGVQRALQQENYNLRRALEQSQQNSTVLQHQVGSMQGMISQMKEDRIQVNKELEAIKGALKQLEEPEPAAAEQPKPKTVKTKKAAVAKTPQDEIAELKAKLQELEAQQTAETAEETTTQE